MSAPDRPTGADPAALGFTRRRSVRWLAPRELASAGVRLALSYAFGEYADKREAMNAMAPSLDHHNHGFKDEVWVDYVADLGDGFTPTYVMADLVARPELVIADAEPLPRAAILVMGGDEVYPTASAGEYADRTVGPYEAALPHTDPPHPQLYAIPGNHDWYDGLTSFMRIFCDGRWLGGWSLRQSRSYFAIKVTPKWWVWGIDIQFDGYIDTPQIEFFNSLDVHIGDDDGIVLCVAKPSWARDDPSSGGRATPSMKNIDYFTKRCVPDRADVRLHLAGDWHHYSRYRDVDDDSQWVTAGGGGAYLSATHHLPDEIELRGASPADDRLLHRVAVYPDTAWSKRRRLTAPLVGLRNPSFATLVGGVYLLLGLVAVSASRRDAETFVPAVGRLADEGFASGWTSAVVGLTSSALTVAMLAALTFVLIRLTQARQIGLALIAGGLHGAAHLCSVAFVVAATTTVLSPFVDGTGSAGVWALFLTVQFAIGAVVGPAVFGVYLGLADIADLNSNELFAGQRIEARKNFVRMRFTRDDVTCYAVGVDRMPKLRFQPEGAATDPYFVAADESSERRRAETRPRIIDAFTLKRVPT